jgi:hypothetical protein
MYINFLYLLLLVEVVLEVHQLVTPHMELVAVAAVVRHMVHLM